ncbi:MAG: chloride channel protein [Bacteroidales bacterium]|nr:chloride channel protein [Bacteroidales bacterium]
MKKYFFLRRLNIWRIRNVSDRNLILILSMVVGFAAGITALGLKTAVFYLRELFLVKLEFHHDNFLLLVLPVIGIILTVSFKKYLIRDTIPHNIGSILHAISKRNSIMRRHKVFSSVAGGALTAGFGGSIGLESPIISSGSAIGSNLGRIMRLNYKTITLLLACGAAGAISAIFNTPIAGIVFALEVLMLDLSRFSLIPLLIASVSGAIITKLLFQDDLLFAFTTLDKFVAGDIPFYILLGILTGFASVYFTKVFLGVEKKFERFKKARGKIIAGGIVLGILIFVFPPLYGEGYASIKLILNGNYNNLFESSLFAEHQSNIFVFTGFMFLLLLLKVVATAITIGSGGVGGIFAPSLFMGAILGFLFAFVYNYMNTGNELSVSNFALVAMAGVLGGVLHAPLTGIFLIAEVTSGYELIVPLMLTTTISFVTVKYFQPNSIFTFQLAERGELITHHKDKAVLKFMSLLSVIEKDMKEVNVDAKLGELVKIIANSRRNIFPVLDNERNLIGLVMLDQIRHIIFERELYDSTYVRDLMVFPQFTVSINDSMEDVAQKFQDSGAFNIPVVDSGKYVGFVSRSTVFSAYRNMLKEISEE